MKQNATHIGMVTAKLINAIIKMPLDAQENLLMLVGDWSEDARRFPRRETLIDIDYSDDERSAQGFILNIGPGGACIKPGGPFPKGSPLVMLFRHPKNNQPLRKTGTVVWRDQHATGIAFTREAKDMLPQ